MQFHYSALNYPRLLIGIKKKNISHYINPSFMENDIYPLLITFLPSFFLLIYSIIPGEIRSLPRISMGWAIFFTAILVFCIGNYPFDLSSDKYSYASMYYRALHYGTDYEFRDYGWIVYNIICSKIFGNVDELFFLTTALVYVGGYYFFAKEFFSKNALGYFLVMSAGCLGFSNYGTNVIRGGFAISLLLISIAWDTKKILRIAIVIIALTIHKSMIIPITAYVCSQIFKEKKWSIGFWMLCLALSAANFDIGPLFESVGFVDERIESYAISVNSEDGTYDKGFRIDFLTYSMVPMFIAFYYVKKKQLSDRFYDSVINTYLWANAIWLLAIRMAYSDRLAYLSWFLIPIITLYPVLKYPNDFRNPHRMALFVMYVFMGVSLMLVMRSMLKGF